MAVNGSKIFKAGRSRFDRQQQPSIKPAALIWAATVHPTNRFQVFSPEFPSTAIRQPDTALRHLRIAPARRTVRKLSVPVETYLDFGPRALRPRVTRPNDTF
jgi:hypothetical protein